MLQLTQKLKNGDMQVLEVPVPAVVAGSVLVRNHFSLISAGTEGSTVKTARSGLISKAKERPQQVRQVIDTLKSQGVTQTYRAVMKKLDAYSPLGYSSTGEVIAVGQGVIDLAVGDLVACGGLSAAHAEIVCVPANLCVRLKPAADLRQAAYNTLGAIAMQGVRQSDLRLGESCAVIGLGLLGQLTALILRAGGIRVVGIDIDPSMVSIAAKRCADIALQRDDPGIVGKIMQFTDGLGCDAVIVTAATSSLDPINFAGEISRKRGTVVVVGAIPTGFDRDPHYYRKELQIKMSCSYGPGRYDPLYEEKGIDYPAPYVRWTERRNMQSFQELIAGGKIDVSYLTTHQYDLDHAPEAYDLLMERTEPYIGILIEYDTCREITNRPLRIDTGSVRQSVPVAAVSVGFIGAGSYAQSHLLPNIPAGQDVALSGIATTSGVTARSVADRFGFAFCTTDPDEILDNSGINTVFIATRHDSHGGYVLQALRAGKHVFVEKPLCLSENELHAIGVLYEDLGRGKSPGQLLVGYNRRFSPLSLFVKEQLGSGPMAMNYRINAGAIPKESWIQDRETGGGRIVGEACHFVDLLTFLNGSLPVSLFAVALREPGGVSDTVQITISFLNGSVGTVSYCANGEKSFPKERLEVFSSGCTAVIDDFRSAVIHGKSGKKERKLLAQDKGQRHEVSAFIENVRTGGKPLIPFEEIYTVMLATLRVDESLRTGQSVRI